MSPFGKAHPQGMDESTLVETYRSLVHELYRFVSVRCGGDRALAEDVTQETWLRAVQSWREDGSPDRPMAWLKTVARNLLSNHFRRVPAISLDAAPPALLQAISGNGQGETDPDHAALLSWGLARLKPSHATLLEAFHLEGRSVRQIAAEHHLSERAVEGRLRRGRLKLRKQLEPVIRAAEDGGMLP